MALYTSYYTRQLALRPESAAQTQSEEGVKVLQQAVPWRTVDATSGYLNWLESRRSGRATSAHAFSGAPTASLALLPPCAWPACPAWGACATLAAQAPSKTRSSVNAMAWSPDGRRCLSGTAAGEFTLWGGQTFQFESILQAHEVAVRCLTHTRSGSFLLSSDDGGIVRFWRPNLELIKSWSAHGEAVRALSCSPGDVKLLTGSDDGLLRVWDFARVKCEQSLAGHGGDVRAAEWHPSSALLASGSKDGLLKLWDARAGGVARHTLHAHRATVTAACWNGNGRWLLSAARDQSARVWDVRMLDRELCAFKGLGRDLTAACWHPLHEQLFSTGAQDGALQHWLVPLGADAAPCSAAAASSKPLAASPGAHEAAVWALAYHPLGHLLASGGADHALRFWCRPRPGDPFGAAQREQERAMEALDGGEPAARAQVAPAVFHQLPLGKGGAIPGLGRGGRPAAPAPPRPLSSLGSSSAAAIPGLGSSSAAAIPGLGSSSAAAIPGLGSSSAAAIPGLGPARAGANPGDVQARKRSFPGA